jgi:hypothetical protein
MPWKRRERLLELHGPTVASQIRANIKASVVTWCGLDDEGVVNLGGAIPAPEPDLGCIWQFVTPDIAKHKRDYIRQGRELTPRLFAHFARLGTVIEAEYGAAIKHAKRMGAAIYPLPQDIKGFPAVYCQAVKNV